MKNTIPLVVIAGFFACGQSSNDMQFLQKRIDSLESKLANTYKPGLGEFMSGIQVHHAKLWFAGQNENWRLADFEMHEIQEAVEAIEKYQTERPESKKIEMIKPALDTVNIAIQQKNSVLFKNSYNLLTTTCNNCHRAVDFEFNVVKVPETPPFNNQDYK